MNHEVHSAELGEGLRSTAVQALAERGGCVDSESTWRDLVEGHACVVDEFFDGESSFLILLKRPGSQSSSLSGRNLDVLEEVLLGADQKVVAIERNLAPSTVAACLRHAYDKLGMTCKPSRVSLLVVTLVHAAKGRGRMAGGRSCEFDYRGATFQVLSMAMPDRVFDRLLPPAEEAVVRMRIQGRSHAEIAARRKTSLRTVANQVATAFQRLGISSRSDLMELLIMPGNPGPKLTSEPRTGHRQSFPSGAAATRHPNEATNRQDDGAGWRNSRLEASDVTPPTGTAWAS